MIGLLLFAGVSTVTVASTPGSQIAKKSEFSVVVDGDSYQIPLYVPQNNSVENSHPLLIAIAGIGDPLLRFIRATDLARMASLHGFVVAFPQVDQHDAWLGWLKPSGNINRAAVFFRSIIGGASKQASIQIDKVYLTGFSTGGMLVLSAMCDMSKEVAAFGVVSASLPRAQQAHCRIKRAVPAIIFASRNDPVLPWDGGEFSVPLTTSAAKVTPATSPTIDVLPVDDTVALWRANNRCNPRPVLEPLANVDPSDRTTVTRLKYDFECRNDAYVLLYAVTRGGHTWPGSVTKLPSFEGVISQDISASNTIWEFVRKYSLVQ